MKKILLTALCAVAFVASGMAAQPHHTGGKRHNVHIVISDDDDDDGCVTFDGRKVDKITGPMEKNEIVVDGRTYTLSDCDFTVETDGGTHIRFNINKDAFKDKVSCDDDDDFDLDELFSLGNISINTDGGTNITIENDDDE